MDIQVEKVELAKLLLSVENETIIQRIRAILMEDAFAADKEATDWWDDLPESVQQKVLAAEKEIEDGKGIPHDQVLAMYSSRLKRA